MGDSTAIHVRTGTSVRVIERCEARVRRFVEYDAYADYDHAGSKIVGDTLTREHLRLMNSVMRARSPGKAWEEVLDKSLHGLEGIPVDLDLIDSPTVDVDQGLRMLETLVGRIAGRPWITDMGASKMLFLLRPRFVPISDSYVRAMLDVPEFPTGRPRLMAVARRIRDVGNDNRGVLSELKEFADGLSPITPEVGRFKGKPIPLVLSKARILDILLWTEMAIHGPTPHPSWAPWWAKETGEMPKHWVLPAMPAAQRAPSAPHAAATGGAKVAEEVADGVWLFHHAEAEYEAFLAADLGFVCNNLGYGAGEHRLHRSECSMLQGVGDAYTGVRTVVRKACSQDRNALVAWLTAQYGGEGAGFRFCQFCLKDATSPVPTG